MKIRIFKTTDQGECLEINGQIRFCPFAPHWADGTPRRCGSWCPQFGEPVMGRVIEGLRNRRRPGYEDGTPYKDDDYITICQGRVLTGEIIYERKP